MKTPANNFFLFSVLLVLSVSAAQASIDPATVQKLLAEDGYANDRFGRSVSIDGNTAVIGAPYDDDNGSNSGSAYIFTRTDGVWNQQAKLLAEDGDAGDSFGWSVSVSGDTVLIGSVYDDDNGSYSGSAYIFTRINGVWNQQAKLLTGDGEAGGIFGWSVSVSGDTSIIGARFDNDNGVESGSAYIFTRIAGVWSQQAKLLAGDGEAGDQFGFSVSMSVDTAAVGAHADDDNGIESGSVYMFAWTDGVWSQQAKLIVEDASNAFGKSVALCGDTVVVGAPYDDDQGSTSGAAYVFIRTDGVWIQQAKLLAGDGAIDDIFGRSVSISENIAVIGANGDDDRGSSSGSAYVFIFKDGIWSQQVKLLAEDGLTNDAFGKSVTVSGKTVVIGSSYYDDDTMGENSGSAYVFSSDNTVETTLQQLIDAVTVLNPSVFKKNKMQKILINQIDGVVTLIDQGSYAEALDKLENSILGKFDGCDELGEPDKNDWILNCSAQEQLYSLVGKIVEEWEY